MNLAEDYRQLFRRFGPTKLEALLMELDEGNTYIVSSKFGLSKVEFSWIRHNATALLTYHIKESRAVIESFLAA